MSLRAKTWASVVIALVFFVIPVSIGWALSEPVRWPIEQPSMDLDAPIPADGVVRFSGMNGYGSHWSSCTDYEVRLTEEQRATPGMLQAVVVDRAGYDDPATATCAERFPYAPVARCTREWTRMPQRGPDGELIDIHFVERQHLYEPDGDDRTRCRRGGQWEENP